jgi:hypothetical protein
MSLDIVQSRLHNQLLSHAKFSRPEEVVAWLGAVQSQDYAGAKWALGLRINGATDAAMDRAFNEGKILRTHMLRPTWHFVTPQDIRWILMLTAPRVHMANAFMYRQQELDQATIRKSYAVLEKVLQGNKQLTRTELGIALEQAGIKNAKGIRLGYFLMSAELDGVICSGARNGKQFTYALLEERAPKVDLLKWEEALAELTRRYFATRGPATLQDFTWWSGLTMLDAKQGMESIHSQFAKAEIDGKTYWFDKSRSPVRANSPSAHLLPNYDEYFIGLKDRSAIGKLVSPLHPEENAVALNAHIVILDGQIVGGWRRTVKKKAVLLEFSLITNLTTAQQDAVNQAANRYGEFMQLPVELVRL